MATVNESPQTEPVARPRSQVLAIVAIGLCCFVLVGVLTTRGRIIRTLAEFELAMPILTQVAISWLFPAVLGIVTVFGIIKEAVPADGSIVNGCNVAILIAAIGALLIYLAGVLIPLSNLMTALS